MTCPPWIGGHSIINELTTYDGTLQLVGQGYGLSVGPPVVSMGGVSVAGV